MSIRYSNLIYVIDDEGLNILTNNIKSLPLLTDIGIDFETHVLEKYANLSSGLDPYCNNLRLLSINWLESDLVYVIDLDSVNISNLLLILSDETKYILWVHNAAIEVNQIGHHYNIWLNNLYCSLMLFNTLYVSTGWKQGKQIGTSLRAIMRHFQEVVMNKSLQTSDWSGKVLSEAQLIYSAEDVSSSWLELIIRTKKILFEEYQQQEAFYLDQEAMRLLAKAEYTGFFIDTNKMNNFIVDLEQKSKASKISLAKQLDLPLSVELVDGSELEMSLTVSPNINKMFNSPAKLAKYISTKFKVKLTALNAFIVKEFLLDEEQEEEEEDEDLILDDITSKEEAKEVLRTLVTYKQQEKLITEITKYLSIINPVTKSLHATTNAVGASTGRMSSSSSIIVGDKKYKMNLQQVIARGDYNIRSGFIARPGYVIAGIDFDTQIGSFKW